MLRAVGLTVIIAVCAFSAALTTPQASAANTVLSMDSITITPGGGVTLDLDVESIPSPGLGAWSVAVEYDPSVLSALSCETSLEISKCNIAFAANQVASSTILRRPVMPIWKVAKRSTSCNCDNSAK